MDIDYLYIEATEEAEHEGIPQDTQEWYKYIEDYVTDKISSAVDRDCDRMRGH